MALQKQHWVVTVALVASSFIALVANLLLLLVFFRRRGLRTVSNRFTINLLLTNLLSSVLLIPLLIADHEVAVPKNVTTLHVKNLDVEDVRIHGQPLSSPTSIIVEEVNEKEIIASDAFDVTEEVVISDKFKLDISVNNSGIIEKASNISALNYTKTVDHGDISNVLCYVTQSIVGLVCTASILSVLLIGIDQYFAVIHSLRYHSYINKCRSMTLILASWLIAFFFAIFGGLTQNESNLWQFCPRTFNITPITEDSEQLKTLNSVYAFLYFFSVILIPFLAICVIYVCIYAAARNNSERMRQSTKGNSQSNLATYIQIPNNTKTPSESRLDLKSDSKQETHVSSNQCNQVPKGLIPKVQSAPNFSIYHKGGIKPPLNEPLHAKVKRACSERSGFITNLKYKLSNASVFRYREETRAAKVSILVIFMVLVCYIPYGLAVVLNSYAVEIRTPQSYNFAALVLLVFSNIISPLLFAYRNRRIRRELLRFLRLAPARNVSSSLLRKSIVKPNSILPPAVQKHRMIEEECEKTEIGSSVQPFLANACSIPQVIITYKMENEKPEKESILKRVCSGKNWSNYKKCSFINVPECCWQTDSARGSFSSASTQMSSED